MAFQFGTHGTFPQSAKALAAASIGNDSDVNNDNSGNAIFGNKFANMLLATHATNGTVTIILKGGESLLINDLDSQAGWVAMPPFKNVQADGTSLANLLVGVSWE